MKTAGINQRALAEKTGITQSTLSRCFAGKREFDLGQLWLICQALNIRLDRLASDAQDIASGAPAIDVIKRRL